MLKLLLGIFGWRPEPEPAAQPAAPAELSDAMKAHLVRWVLSVIQVTYPSEDDFYVEAFVAEAEFVSWKSLLRRGEMLSKDELRALGLNPTRKVARQFVDTLTPEARRDVQGAAIRIANTVHVALENRLALDEATRWFGDRTKVILRSRDRSPPRCERGRAWAEVTWSSVAPDLPIAGCDAECDCHHRIIHDFG